MNRFVVMVVSTFLLGTIGCGAENLSCTQITVTSPKGADVHSINCLNNKIDESCEVSRDPIGHIAYGTKWRYLGTYYMQSVTGVRLTDQQYLIVWQNQKVVVDGSPTGGTQISC